MKKKNRFPHNIGIHFRSSIFIPVRIPQALRYSNNINLFLFCVYIQVYILHTWYNKPSADSLFVPSFVACICLLISFSLFSIHHFRNLYHSAVNDLPANQNVSIYLRMFYVKGIFFFISLLLFISCIMSSGLCT